MAEPVCQVCYRAELSEEQKVRFDAEPVTGCIHLCRKHQQDLDRMLEHLPTFPIYKRKKGYW